MYAKEGKSRSLRGLRLFKQVLCFCQIRLHSDVVSEEAFGRILLQGAAVGGHRLGQQFIPLRTPRSGVPAPWIALPDLVWTAAQT